MNELSNRFPRWIHEDYPAKKYEVGLGRKLFGKQRYSVKPVKGAAYHNCYHKIHDHHTEEEAQTACNTINLYAKIYELYEKKKYVLLREILINITGESISDISDMTDRSVLADILYSDPGHVDNALKVLDT